MERDGAMVAPRELDLHIVARIVSARIIRWWLVLCCVATGPMPVAGSNELADPQIEQAGNDVLAGIEHAEEFIKDGQWNDAVETISRLKENYGHELIEVPVSDLAGELGFARLIPVSTYCQRKLASWQRRAPEALSAYRRRVDQPARQWYEEAIASGNEKLLRRIVDELLLSGSGDQALLRLGELALERGNYTLARSSWQQISPQLRVPRPVAELLGCTPGCRWWAALRNRPLDQLWPQIREAMNQDISDPTWLAYPDPDVSLAAARSRLILVSLLQGNRERAELEFELMRRLHPDDIGTLAGRRGTYVDLMADIVRESSSWAGPARPPGWTTLGGCPARNGVAAEPVDVARQPVWQAVLPRFADDRDMLAGERARVGEQAGGLLSYHAAVRDGVVFVQQPGMIRAFGLTTGKPAWSLGGSGKQPNDWSYGAIRRWSDVPPNVIPARSTHAGVPRYSVTISGHRLFARIGSAWTGGDEPPAGTDQRSSLVGIDLRTQKLIFEETPPGEAGWEFGASPLATDGFVFATLRRRDPASAQVRVACFAIDTGRLVWQRDLLRSEAVGDVTFEMANCALTFGNDTLYYNTNLGAVAALDVEDGNVRWIWRYPRRGLRGGDPDYDDRHWARDQTPCLLHRDLVIAAPADCNRIMALDAGSGRIVWATAAGVAADATHLLGVGQGHLLVGGDYLYWIDLYSGKLNYQFPAPRSSLPGHAGASPRGYGRGILAGDQIFWPTHENIYVFRQTDNRQVRQPIELQSLGLTGGNLVIADDTLLIVGADRLTALNPWGQPVADRSESDRGETESQHRTVE